LSATPSWICGAFLAFAAAVLEGSTS